MFFTPFASTSLFVVNRGRVVSSAGGISEKLLKYRKGAGLRDGVFLLAVE